MSSKYLRQLNATAEGSQEEEATDSSSSTITIILLAIAIPLGLIFLGVFGYVCFIRFNYKSSFLDSLVHVFCCEFAKIRALREREQAKAAL